jgi:hypothetical protein
MDVVSVVYIYTVVVGITAAGLTGSAWAIMSGSRPGFQLLLEPSLLAPVRAMVVVISAPLLILFAGCRKLDAHPIFGGVLIAASLGWSFLQGVFILTQFFGVT